MKSTTAQSIDAGDCAAYKIFFLNQRTGGTGLASCPMSSGPVAVAAELPFHRVAEKSGQREDRRLPELAERKTESNSRRAVLRHKVRRKRRNIMLETEGKCGFDFADACAWLEWRL